MCYAGVFDGASLDVELPQHRPSLLSSHPLLNNALLLFIFLGSHRCVVLDVNENWSTTLYSNVH